MLHNLFLAIFLFHNSSLFLDSKKFLPKEKKKNPLLLMPSNEIPILNKPLQLLLCVFLKYMIQLFTITAFKSTHILNSLPEC